MCDFIRVSGVWCGIGVVLVWFDPKSTFLKTRKRNKLGHYRISTLSEGFHCREFSYVGSCIFTYAVYNSTYLACAEMPGLT